MEIKSIPESLSLPNISMLSETGKEYIRDLSRKSQEAYQTIGNRTVKYGNDIREGLDIFFPDKIKKPLPILIFIHGGYWINGCKEMMGYIAPDIISLPMIFVSIGYKLSPEYKFPVALEDCKKALNTLYNCIEQYGGDKNKIVISGHSAGATLAVLLTLKKNWVVPENCIKLCTPVSGVYNVHDVPLEIRSKFIDKEEDYIEASPLYADFSNTNIPFFLTRGEDDFSNVKRSHELMIAKMRYINKQSKEFIESKKNHFEISLSITKKNHPWLENIKKTIF